MDFLITIISAFLGGIFVFLVQWYSFRNDRFSTRRNVLYYLLEIYSNLHKIKNLPMLNELYTEILIEQGIITEEIIDSKNRIFEKSKGQIYSEVFKSLDELNEKYPILVENLSKENPILAYYISNHGKSLKKMFDFFDKMAFDIKATTEPNEHKYITSTFDHLIESNLINSIISDVRNSALEISRGISFITFHQIKKELDKIEDSKRQREYMQESILSIFDSLDEL
jgi:hypothetical protein